MNKYIYKIPKNLKYYNKRSSFYQILFVRLDLFLHLLLLLLQFIASLRFLAVHRGRSARNASYQGSFFSMNNGKGPVCSAAASTVTSDCHKSEENHRKIRIFLTALVPVFFSACRSRMQTHD